MKNGSLKKAIFKYSILFAFFVGIILLIFKIYDKSFVWINTSNDGLDQHLVNLKLFKDFLLNFIKTGNINAFTWQIGYGMDMFANFAYYVFGDFLAYLSIFVPDNCMGIFYNFLVISRLYLAGITFLIYCNYKKTDCFSSILGSVIYTFSSFGIFAMARHPYFINALVVFPLMLMFIEKIIKDDKKIGFTISVALLFVTSFYFGYMIALWIMIYGIIFSLNLYKKDYKLIIKKLLITFMCAVIGLLISAAIVYPTLMAFLSSTRTGSNLYFYSFEYYLNLITSVVSVKNTENWSLIGVSSLFLILIPQFIENRKKYKTIFFFLICTLVPLFIPMVGMVFAGMSYPNNRWAFIISFFFAFIVTLMLPQTEKVNIKKYIKAILAYSIVIFIIYKKIDLQIVLAMICAGLFLLTLNNKQSLKKSFKPLLTLILIINIGFNIFYLYDKRGYNYINEFVHSEPLLLYNDANGDIPYLNDASDYLKSIDDSYYNVLIYPNKLYNLSLINNYNSNSYFYSIVSNEYLELATELENQELGLNKEIKSFNYRTMITTLLNNKYIITTNKDFIPYGYEMIKNYDDKTYIYKNNYFTSFANLYTTKINSETYQKQNPLEKEYYMLKTTVLDEQKYSKTNIFKEELANSTIQNVKYNVIDNDLLTENKIKIDSKDTNIKISVDMISKKEVYLYIKNINFKNRVNIESGFTITASIGEKSISEYTSNKYKSPYYFKNDDILINLGYYDEFPSDITLCFSSIGTYTFDELQILALDFSEYEEDINNLKRSNFSVKEHYNNYLTGVIDADDDGVLQFSTNYSKGWKVFVDDKEVETFVSNNHFLAIDINSGVHEIKMIYETPGVSTGILLSITGMVLFCGLLGYELWYKKRVQYK